MLRNGVIGYQLPALRAEVLPLQAASDTVILVTDGIKPDFDDELNLRGDASGAWPTGFSPGITTAPMMRSCWWPGTRERDM